MTKSKAKSSGISFSDDFFREVSSKFKVQKLIIRSPGVAFLWESLEDSTEKPQPSGCSRNREHV